MLPPDVLAGRGATQVRAAVVVQAGAAARVDEPPHHVGPRDGDAAADRPPGPSPPATAMEQGVTGTPADLNIGKKAPAPTPAAPPTCATMTAFRFDARCSHQPTCRLAANSALGRTPRWPGYTRYRNEITSARPAPPVSVDSLLSSRYDTHCQGNLTMPAAWSRRAMRPRPPGPARSVRDAVRGCPIAKPGWVRTGGIWCW